jgi:hypothetical protein
MPETFGPYHVHRCSGTVSVISARSSLIFLTHFQNLLKFHEKFVHWEPSCSIRTDRHVEVNNSRISQFCESSYNVSGYMASRFEAVTFRI